MIDNIFDLPDDEIEVAPPGMEFANCLVVPGRAKSPAENGGVDELTIWEAQYRRSETLPVYFTDGNTDTDGVERLENNPALFKVLGIGPRCAGYAGRSTGFHGCMARWIEDRPRRARGRAARGSPDARGSGLA
jgi:hypothetical protein